MADIHEVSAPASTTASNHTMSAEGAARLAALAPDQKQIPSESTEPAQEPTPVVKDADGGEANVATGEYKAPDKPRPPVEVDLEAIPQLAVSDVFRPEAEAYREDVAAIATEYPSLKNEASVLYEYIGSAAAAELAKATTDSDWQQGQAVGPDLRNPDQCRQVLRMRFGESMADGLMDQAAKEFAKLPESVRGWIDADVDGTGRRIGNHPDLVVGLALRAFAQLSPEAAQKELAMVRQSTSYAQGDKLQVAKARMLQIVVGNAQAKTDSGKSIGKFTPPSTRKDFGAQPQAASLQKEVDALRRHVAYADRYHPAHKEVVAQMNELYRRMYPSESK
jgi:hypothetical protein